MKCYIIAAAVAILTMTPLDTKAVTKVDTDSQDHVLVALWQAYDKAQRADKPQDELKALKDIMTEARSRKLAWDFYDAAQKTADVRSSINWKDRAKAQDDFARQVEEFGEPAAVFFLRSRNGASSEDLLKYARDNRSRLQQTRNVAFHKNDFQVNSSIYSAALLTTLQNDWDYVLWHCYLESVNGYAIKPVVAGRQSAVSAAASPAVGILEEGSLGGGTLKYPWNAFVDYDAITAAAAGWADEYARGENKDDKDKEAKARAAFRDYREKYKGRAAELLGWQELLRIMMRGCETEADYKALYAECKTFEKHRATFPKSSDTEYEIAHACNYAEVMIGTLEDSMVSIEMKDGRLLVQFRNLPSGTLKVNKDKKTVWQTVVKNPVRSFFVPDSVWVDVPVMDDGDYEMVCTNGKTEGRCSYNRHTLSIANRRDSRGLCVYVADYKTGEPVGKCDLTLLDNSGNTVATAKGLSMDGFTLLPSSFRSAMSNGRRSYRLVASAGTSPRRQSNDCYIYSSGSSVEDEGGFSCSVFTDRAAFNPGDTVHFKVVAWSGTYDMKAVPAGTVLTAAIFGPDGTEIERKDLVTNDFGSAEGEFELVRTDRGGIRQIRIEKNGWNLGGTSIHVDDFVLPTFTLEWEKDNRIYVPGDTLEFRGRVSAYSGHNLAAATARYEISRYSEIIQTGTVEFDSMGRFVVDCPVPVGSSASYNLKVIVWDATAETLEFNDSRYVRDYLNLLVQLKNPAKGKMIIGERSGSIVSEDEAVFGISVYGQDSTAPGLKVRWTFSRGGAVLQSGELGGSGSVSVPLAGMPSGLYRFDVDAVLKGPDGREYKAVASQTVFKMSDSDNVICDDVKLVVRSDGHDPMTLHFGSTSGRTWFVTEVFGDGNVLLESRMVTLDGVKGAPGSLETVRFERKDGWPGRITLKVLAFKDGESLNWSHEIEPAEPADKTTLPLSFTRFLDTTLPGTGYSFEIATAPGVECAAAVFDKSTETIRYCDWHRIYHPQKPLPEVFYSCTCGGVSGYSDRFMVGYGGSNRMVMKQSRAAVPMAAEAAVMDSAVMNYALTGSSEEIEEEEAIPFQLVDRDRNGMVVRENFANTVAWEPFLRSDDDGRIKFEFRTADKLSTYVVQLFAHDRNMNSAALRREMLITLPVQVAVVEPQYLYAGDRYVVHATLSNSSGDAVSGKVVAEFYDGETYKDAVPVGADAKAVTVAAGDAAECAFEAPVLGRPGASVLGLLLRFIPDGGAGSDAVFVTVPVKRAAQTITEAHSGLLKAGQSRSELEARLRSMFVNVPGSEAFDTLISIRQMLRDAVPQSVVPKSDNVLALLDAVYSNILARRLGAPGASDADLEQLEKKIAACRNADGGYAWFEGMKSSPVVTAALLERLHRMAAAGYVVPSSLDTSGAALFLDTAYFDEHVRPLWCGGISMEQYLYVRSLYPVAFKEPSISAKSWKEHKKAIKDYLAPSGARGLNGQILAKARRLATLRALLASQAGTGLAAAWGIALPSKMSRSVTADVESLLQYSVEHWAGGCYYPNAVMPWRGLLESELYAHNMLARLLEAYGHDEVADGIRLWMMIQKETQQWESDPAYVEALGCVFEGSEAMLQTSVLALSATVEKPFDSIVAAGNDFTVSRRWSVARGDGAADPSVGKYVELRDGDVLHIGDKVRAEYCIWNRENRSFVKLTAPRPAAMRPCEQLSGHIGWWLRPLRVSGWYDVSPQGYRSVLTDRTEYWFDSYPEENTTMAEEFFVTQEGLFQTPVVEIESLYAPHYRANSAGEAPVVVVR